MEKQIEEMVKELAKDMGIAFQLANTTRFGVIAADLIEIGYRKIPEGAVVLTREEYNGFKIIAEKQSEIIYETEKKTAEKFAERLKSEFRGEDFYCDFIVWKIDEIVKEITEGEV